jgi:hypothetical protein
MGPEAKIRQALLEWMVAQCGYPRSLLAVEGEIEKEGGRESGWPRRFDIVCYQRCKDRLQPLLLVECKAGALTEKAERQLLGYNLTIQAPFLALANGSSLQTIWFEKGEKRSIPFLPSYQQLLEKRCSVSMTMIA